MAHWSSGLGCRVFTPCGHRFESDMRYCRDTEVPEQWGCSRRSQGISGGLAENQSEGLTKPDDLVNALVAKDSGNRVQ